MKQEPLIELKKDFSPETVTLQMCNLSFTKITAKSGKTATPLV